MADLDLMCFLPESMVLHFLPGFLDDGKNRLPKPVAADFDVAVAPCPDKDTLANYPQTATEC